MLSINFKSTLHFRGNFQGHIPMTINTYNESSLHKTLKNYYAIQYQAQTEVPFNKWIADIMCSDGSIIEIQTGSLTPLKSKIEKSIEEKRKIILVHPIITEKKIETWTEEGSLISKRKSPKKENLYSALKQLTGICDLILNKYVTVILVEVKTTEQRIQTKEKIQLNNKSRHFMKNWYKSGKDLTELGKEYIFKTKKDYLKLLPTLPETFSSKELKEEFSKINSPASVKNQTNLILWFFSHIKLIEEIEIKERRKYYRFK